MNAAAVEKQNKEWIKDETDPMSVLDTQVGGEHYKELGQFQPWEVASAWLTPEELKGAMKLTVMSYLARESEKGGRQDIEKAMHTMQLYLEVSGRNVSQT